MASAWPITDGSVERPDQPPRPSEVSELSTEGAIQMEGFQIPALTIRRAETTVELGSGESFMIAGLMNNRSIGAIDKMPGLGDAAAGHVVQIGQLPPR